MTRRESGKGAIGLILFLVIIGFGIFFLVKYVPRKIDANQFREEMSRFNNDPDYRMRHFSQEQVVDILYKKAQDLNLPIEKQNIKVDKNGDIYKMEVSFQIPIDLKVTTINQKYDFKEPRGSINTAE